MRRSALTGQRLAATFLFGLLLFFSPLTSLFDRPTSWGAIPLIYLYLFGAWALFIVLLAWILEGHGE